MTIGHGMTPGAYAVRADEINPADASVTQTYQGDNYWIYNCAVCHKGGGEDGRVVAEVGWVVQGHERPVPGGVGDDPPARQWQVQVAVAPGNCGPEQLRGCRRRGLAHA